MEHPLSLLANQRDTLYLKQVKPQPQLHKQLPSVLIGCAIALFFFLPFTLVVMVALVLSIGYYIYRIQMKNITAKRIAFITRTPFPLQIWQNSELRALNLSTEQQMVVTEALRDFFLIHVLNPKRAIAMPSKLVDQLWHALILDTAGYAIYCKHAFGKMLHHIPDYAFTGTRADNARMFTYQAACRLHGMNPAHANGVLPRLFAIDEALNHLAPLNAASALVLHGTLVGQYQQWYESVTGSIADSNASGCDYSDADVTSCGDASCSSSSDGGDGCGGGCGGD